MVKANNRNGDSRPSTGELTVEAVSHSYPLSRGRAVEVLKDVSFQVPAETVACLVGPSGCGKSTLLGMAGGLLAPSSGLVRWDGQPVRAGPNHDIAMAFQQPGLFPWMTVRRNVTVGLETRGHGRAEARRIADEVLETVGLSEFRSAYPSQLSGGMAQRAGIARAFALRPRLLLLDEPFAAVDAFTRLALQSEFKALLEVYRPTVLFVTHDVDEAISVGDVVVSMTSRPGQVKSIIPINDADRERGSTSYAQRLAEVLASLGVTSQDTSASTNSSR